MSYVPAARKEDKVAYAAKSEGEAAGHALGLLIAELFIPKTPAEVYKLIPALKLARFPAWAAKLAKTGKGLQALRGRFVVARATAIKGLREVGTKAAIEAANTLVKDELKDLGGMAGLLLNLSGAPIEHGSTNVLINIREAARVDDKVEGYQEIAEGSKLVIVNLKPAARFGDKTRDNGTIVEGSFDVFMGGEPVSAVEIKERSMGWVSDVLDVLGKGIGKGLKPDKRIKKWLTRGERIAEKVKDVAIDKAKDVAKDKVKETAKEIFGGGKGAPHD